MVFVELWNLAWHLHQQNAELKQISAHCDKKLLNEMRVSFAFKECPKGSLSAFIGSIHFTFYSFKYKNIQPSLIEYVNQVRSNLKIEKHVSIITGT